MPNKSIVRFLKTYYKRNNKLFKEDLEKFYDEFLMTAEGGVEICLALEFGVWYENFNSNKDSMIPLIFELKRNGITDEKTLSWNTLFHNIIYFNAFNS